MQRRNEEDRRHWFRQAGMKVAWKRVAGGRYCVPSLDWIQCCDFQYHNLVGGGPCCWYLLPPHGTTALPDIECVCVNGGVEHPSLQPYCSIERKHEWKTQTEKSNINKTDTIKIWNHIMLSDSSQEDNNCSILYVSNVSMLSSQLCCINTRFLGHSTTFACSCILSSVSPVGTSPRAIAFRGRR